jgi:hypothetical protein
MRDAIAMPRSLEDHVDSSDASIPGLTRAKVEEFRALLEGECGLHLELDEAWKRAVQLIALYRMLMGPIPEDPGVRTSANLPSRPGDTHGVLQ